MRYILQEGPRCAERDEMLSQQHNTQLLDELVRASSTVYMARIPKDNQILEENHKGLITLFTNLKRLQLQ